MFQGVKSVSVCMDEHKSLSLTTGIMNWRITEHHSIPRSQDPLSGTLWITRWELKMMNHVLKKSICIG